MRLYSRTWLKLFSPTIAALAVSLSVNASAHYGWAPAPHVTAEPTVESATSWATEALRGPVSSADMSITSPVPSPSVDWYRWLDSHAPKTKTAAKLTYMRLLAAIPLLEPPSSVVTESGSVLAVWRDKTFHAEVEFYEERVAWLLVSKLGSRRVVSSSDDNDTKRVSPDFVRLFCELRHAGRTST